MSEDLERGTLKKGELHPSTSDAMGYIKSFTYAQLCMYLESFSSCAIEGNRLAEICACTLNRYIEGDNISDRYILGLSWALRNMEDSKKGVIQ